jgi:hypothetical protein
MINLETDKINIQIYLNLLIVFNLCTVYYIIIKCFDLINKELNQINFYLIFMA